MGAYGSHLVHVPLIPTLILLAVCLAAVVFTGWRGARPPDIMRGPRMMPWRFLMLLFGALSVFLLIHVATLFGVQRPGAGPGGL